jgi:hypothetical protein
VLAGGEQLALQATLVDGDVPRRLVGERGRGRMRQRV